MDFIGQDRSSNYQHAAGKRSGIIKGTFSSLLHLFTSYCRSDQQTGKVWHHHRLPHQRKSRKLNYHVKAFVQLQLEPRQKKEFYPYIAQVPNVIECNCVTGDFPRSWKLFSLPLQISMILSMKFSSALANQYSDRLFNQCRSPRRQTATARRS